jgi:hypothetical protein
MRSTGMKVALASGVVGPTSVDGAEVCRLIV